MLRVALFLLLVFAIGFGFAWLADMPGEVVVTVSGQEMTVSLMFAAVVIVSIIAAFMLIWWLFKVVLTSPQRMQRFFRARRRDRGYQSLSTGIIAAGAGDPATARRMLKQADGLLNSTTEPLIQLLDAQATMLEGDHAAARKKFEAMLDDGETRVLGLRGLYMEAQRLGDRQAQKHYAEKAAEIAPHLGWAGKAALDLKTASGDWEGALALLDKQKATKSIDKDEAKRKRAVLLTALAMQHAESDPAKAKTAAGEAHKLLPEFAPAAVAAAEAAFRLNDMRRGVKILESTWRNQPHPDVAMAYVNARPGDSALDRLKKARKLEQLKPNNIDSSLIVARMALEAGEFEEARKAVASVLRNEPRESAFVLMADIEDAETGNQGKVREWLSRAMRAPRDPAWTADGYVSDRWAPFSPVTGRIDAFEWKVPVERLGGAMIENDLDPMAPGEKLPDAVPVIVAGSAAMPSSPASATSDEPVIQNTKEDVEEAEVVADVEMAEAKEEADRQAAPEVIGGLPEPESKEDSEAEDAQLRPIPDDPGVDPSEQKDTEPKRFRLF